ncbi:apolipoprotein D-like [Cimex lectularius]|uniref:Lipocalin/cytosolic fatty-acid binding domain-containing protein n=1 Tax=Cimex lectularius TaxID=79782 RepID=A0A8I6RFD6_CIMLE|nr:apolipoprotein D-like [Cimex lectularius]
MISSVQLVVFFLLVATSAAQRPAFGRCPTVEPKENFDVEKFVGNWVEIERSFYLFESSLSCTKVNFTLYENSTLKADVNYRVPWRGTSSVSSYFVKDATKTPGELNMVLASTLPSLIARMAPGSGKYIVLDTDYTDFALIYSCTDLRFVHADFIWVLGRGSDISVEARTVVYSTLDKNKINRDRLLLTNNKDC